MSFYPITVNYWTMSENCSGKGNFVYAYFAVKPSGYSFHLSEDVALGFLFD